MSKSDLTIPSLFNVKGKIALVTGGGSGIGKFMTTALVQNGAKVYIAARKEHALKETTKELNSQWPDSVEYIVANINSKAGCDALVAEFKKRETKLHILVNNSGITWGAPFDDFPEKGWDNVMAVNVKSIFYLTSGLSDLLEKDSTAADPASVINISSVASLEYSAQGPLMQPGHGVWSYNASKAAVNHLTTNLACLLAPRHININALLCGVFPSNMTSYGFKNNKLLLEAGHPSGRAGTPSDIAGAVLFLASPAAAHVTGAHLRLDGGATLWEGHAAMAAVMAQAKL